MHLEEILVPMFVFACTFGIFYLYFTTRHRERMSLIDKGADASLFQTKRDSSSEGRRLVILNLALTAVGVGLGITMAIFLYQATGEEAVYPASIFLMSGLGLLASYFIGNKKKD
jgi:hypothetical protein